MLRLEDQFGWGGARGGGGGLSSPQLSAFFGGAPMVLVIGTAGGLGMGLQTPSVAFKTNYLWDELCSS